MGRMMAVLTKELRDVLRHPGLIGTMLVPTVVLSLLPILAFYAAASAPGELVVDGAGLPAVLAHASPAEIAQYLAVSPFFLIWLIFPVSIPSALAAYSIVGEKEEGTLEPLLATPLGTGELLAAKALAAALPGVVLVWVPYLATLIAGLFQASPRVLAATVFSPGWILGLALVVPLLTFLTVMLLVLISARVQDVRTAHQLGSLLVIPVVGLFLTRVSRGISLSPITVMAIAGILLVLGLVAMAFAIRLFQRETVLVRWKQSR